MMKRQNNLIFFSLGMLAVLALSAWALMPLDLHAYEARVDGYGTSEWPTYTKPVTNPSPSVRSISPDSANLGEGSKTITIFGKGFVPTSVARIDGVDRQTTFIDYSHLMVQLNSNDTVGASVRYITVFNPAPSGGYSNAVTLAINGGATSNTSATNGNQSTNVIYNNGNTSTANGSAYPANGNAYPVNGNTYPVGEQTGATTKQTKSEGGVSNLAASAIFGTTTFMPSGIVQWIFFAILILLIVILVRKVFRAEEKYQETPLKHA